MDDPLRFGYRYSFLNNDSRHAIAELFDNADNVFFARILSNSEHLLHQFLPERLQVDYNFRERPHNKFLLAKTTFLDDDFLIRMLYKHSY
jgi:hypothetical protein